MKTCQVCDAESRDDTPTCHTCGEASWSPVVEAPKPTQDKRGKR